MTTWEDFYITVGTRPNREIADSLSTATARRSRATVTPTASHGQSRFEIGDIGVLPDVHPHIRMVRSGEAAERAGLHAGDVIVAIDGEPMTFSSHLREAISKHPEQPITIDDPPQRDAADDPGDAGAPRRRRVPRHRHRRRHGQHQAGRWSGASRMSVEKNVQFSGMIFQTRLGSDHARDVAAAADGTGRDRAALGRVGAARLDRALRLMAQISLNLGLLNLMPIPILDGGHIFIMALEGVARRDFSIRVKEKMLLAGFVVLMMLMVTVIYNDLTRISWIERLMPWR